MTFPQIERITLDSQVMGGKPCIRGMRVTVGTITGMLASGCREDELSLSTLIWRWTTFVPH